MRKEYKRYLDMFISILESKKEKIVIWNKGYDREFEKSFSLEDVLENIDNLIRMSHFSG